MLGKRVRWCLVVAAVISAMALGGVVPTAAATRAGTSGPPLPDLRGARSLARGSGPAAPTRPHTSANCSTLFTQVTSLNASTDNELFGVAAISPTDIWSVGFSNSGATNAPDQTLAEHWNGFSWTIVGTPNSGSGHNDLSGVAANDSNDVWAVGNSQNGGIFYTLAENWNGVSWSGVATPQLSNTANSLGGITAVGHNNLYAAGFYRDNTTMQDKTLVIHWDGATWTAMTTPNPGAGSNVLETISATAANDIWAVGYYRATVGSARLTLIEHFDGTTWSVQTSQNPVSPDNTLFGVSGVSATDVWVDGYSNNGIISTTLTEHLVSGVWTTVASPNIGAGDNVLFGLVTISPSNAWASGFGKPDTLGTTGGLSLAEHWDGSSWTKETADSPGGNFGNSLDALAVLPGNNVWATGGAFGSTTEDTLTEQFQLPAPTAVTAAVGDNSAMLTWALPTCNGGFPTTGFQVTAWDGCVPQLTLPAASSPFTFPGVTNGSPFTFTVQTVGTTLGPETQSTPSPVVTPAGLTATTAFSACSKQQYSLLSPNGTNFTDIDSTKLKLMVTPSVDSIALISANADLWTATAGVNQDIGINVIGGTFSTGTVVAWKESGGLAGTFSPNAAAVQTAIQLRMGVTYTVTIQWKANHTSAGTIFAGAGPLPGGGGNISPTRLAVRLFAAGTNLQSAITTKQYALPSSNGTTWTDIDTTGLKLSVSPGVDSTAVITANVDLWTANAGINQDVAINVDGVVVAWKESGGAAGTFSPNAAFVQAVVPLTIAGSPHIIKLQWKTNQNAAGKTIYAAAGPWPTALIFSPTSLISQLVPVAADVNSAGTTSQYSLSNSDGAGWTPIDATNLTTTFTPGATSTYLVTGNADLWTANTGFNQDIGIFISGGQYGAGTLVAWKESGGFAGTFSPNAAYVESVQHLSGGQAYVIWLAWKTSKPGAGSTIYAAAGGLGNFSPTRLTALRLSTP